MLEENIARITKELEALMMNDDEDQIPEVKVKKFVSVFNKTVRYDVALEYMCSNKKAGVKEDLKPQKTPRKCNRKLNFEEAPNNINQCKPGQQDFSNKKHGITENDETKDTKRMKVSA